MASTSITFRNSSESDVVVYKSTEQRQYAVLKITEQCGQVTSVGEKWVVRAKGGANDGKVMARTEGTSDGQTCIVGSNPLGEDAPAEVKEEEAEPVSTNITFVNNTDAVITTW